LIPVPARWRMVAPPQECHRAGSADHRARLLGHHMLALARRPFHRHMLALARRPFHRHMLALASRPSHRQNCVQLPGR
jgi:hypothetical protein